MCGWVGSGCRIDSAWEINQLSSSKCKQILILQHSVWQMNVVLRFYPRIFICFVWVAQIFCSGFQTYLRYNSVQAVRIKIHEAVNSSTWNTCIRSFHSWHDNCIAYTKHFHFRRADEWNMVIWYIYIYIHIYALWSCIYFPHVVLCILRD